MLSAAIVPRMTGTELATIQAVSSTLRSIVAVTSEMVAQLRLNGVVNDEKRQLLRDHFKELRRAEVADAVFRLTRQNIEHVTALFELAEANVSSAGYPAAFAHAGHASRLLADNLDRFVQEVN